MAKIEKEIAAKEHPKVHTHRKYRTMDTALTIESPSPGDAMCKCTLMGKCPEGSCGMVDITLTYDPGPTTKSLGKTPCYGGVWAMGVDLSTLGIPSGTKAELSVACGGNKTSMTVIVACETAVADEVNC